MSGINSIWKWLTVLLPIQAGAASSSPGFVVGTADAIKPNDSKTGIIPNLVGYRVCKGGRLHRCVQRFCRNLEDVMHTRANAHARRQSETGGAA